MTDVTRETAVEDSGRETPRWCCRATRRQVEQMLRLLLDASSDLAACAGELAHIVENRPDEYREDIAEIREGALRLAAFLQSSADPLRAASDEPNFADRFASFRHDVNGHLTGILGLWHLLTQQERDDFFGAYLDELHCLRRFCSSMDASLRWYEVLAEEDRSSSIDSQDTRQATVLLVDDNGPARAAVGRFLQTRGFLVREAGSGEEALGLLKRDDDIDLVVLDLLMPGLTGHQVLGRMRDDHRLQHTPVILISGVGSSSDINRAIAAGAEDMLSKPLDFGRLEARVAAALEKRKQRQRDLEQFFTPEVAHHYVRRPDLLLQGRNAEVTVLFCDVRNFSGISESLESRPALTLSWLTDVLRILSECVVAENGVVVDYTGDELLAMWGAPDPEHDHAERACRAALAMLQAVDDVSTTWQSRIGSPTRIGIGVSTGLAQVGNVGTSRRFKYGPLGNVVNLGSRVQGATKYLRVECLITDETQRRLPDSFRMRRICDVRVRNIRRPVGLFEVQEEIEDAAREALVSGYESALAAFEGLAFTQASKILGDLLAEYPDDGPSLLLMSRAVEALLDQESAFDPVWELPGK